MTKKSETLVVSGLEKLHASEDRLNGFYAERKNESHLLAVAAVSGHNLFLIGSPGTGKDALIQSFVESFEFYAKNPDKYFWSLIGPTLTPDEVFGGFDIKAFEQGEFVRNVEGFAPTAYIANFIELFKGNDVINNTFLTYLNEHKIKNGKESIDVPLLFAVASSNEMPDDNQGALVDRFGLKAIVSPVKERRNLKRIWKNRAAGIKAPDMSDVGITVDEVRAARQAIDEVEISDAMWEVFWSILEELRKTENVGEVSVRKQNIAIDVLRAEALLNGRMSVENEDFEILQHVLWNDPEEAQRVRGIILRVASPMMDEIHVGVDAAKKALEGARKEMRGRAGGMTEEDRIRIGSEPRREIESVSDALERMAQMTGRDTRVGKEVLRAQGKVARYQKALMSEVFGLDVDAVSRLAEEGIDELP
jgi:MoxR-like ATPase